MEPLLVAVVVLATSLTVGGAISYITRRDRRSAPSALDSLTVPPRPGRPAAGPSAPKPIAAGGVETGRNPALVPDSDPWPASDAQGAAHPTVAHEDGQGDASAAREALRANQRAMSDPGLSTLDRVQALMASEAFALHLSDQLAEPPADDKRGPRDQREPL